jgi:hypothetical protein
MRARAKEYLYGTDFVSGRKFIDFLKRDFDAGFTERMQSTC